MKKLVCALLVIFITFPALSQNSPGLSPLTRKYLRDLAASRTPEKVPAGYLYKKGQDGKAYMSVLIQVKDAAAIEGPLQAMGALVGTKAGNIWTVKVPHDQMPAFCQLSGIAYIQTDEPVRAQLDAARKATRVDSVHSGINLPMRYTGKDVVLGVIDFGFDYNHPTFYDTLRAKYRVKRVWELNGVGTPPTGYSYGAELSDTSLIKAKGTDNAKQTHGTGVTGIAAGSGVGSNPSNARYRGIAYEADLVFVGVRRDSIEQDWLEGSFSDFLDGINYIFTYAASVGKPCVVNVSWGSQSGPHDGSTLFNQACNNLTGPGKIVVMSAGNEGEEKIHLSKTFTATDSLLNTFLTFSSNTYKRTWVDVWGEPGETFCGKVTLYNGGAGSTTNFRCIDNSVRDTVLISSNGTDTCFVEFISSSAESNGKPRMTIDVYSKVPDSVNITLKGNSGTIHTWNEYYYYGYKYKYQSAYSNMGKSWASSGNVNSTVSDMGSGDSTLLVGAYASKVNFQDINGSSWTYSGYVQAGYLVPFSSRGPLVDGRVKPDITGPGLTIATAVSSYDTSYTATGSNKVLTKIAYLDPVLNKKFYYSEFSGTSASAPAASGIIALLLQAKPSLGPTEVIQMIKNTAIQDAQTGIIPPGGNNHWGYGKINAYGAMKTFFNNTGVVNYRGEKLDCELYPNPTAGAATLRYRGEKDQVLSVNVYNMLGACVQSQTWETRQGLNSLPVDLSSMAPGVYLVKVNSPKGFVSIRTVKE